MRRTRTAATTTALASLLLATACGGGSGTAGSDGDTLEVWVMSSQTGNEGPTFEQLVADFESVNPGTKIEVQPIPWENAKDKIATAVASGDGPDVVQVGLSLLPELVDSGALMDLSDEIGSHPELAADRFVEGARPTMQTDGKTYSVPWVTDTRALFYRTDLLAEAGYEQPPQTWAELKDAATKLKARGGKNFGISLNVGDQFLPLMFTWQAGGDVHRDDTVDFGVPEFKEAVAYENSFFTAGLTPKAGPWKYDEVQGFKTGVTPMFVSGPWMTKAIQEQAPEINGKWALSLMPGDTTRTAFLGGSSLGVFSKSKNSEGALKLLAYLSQKDTQLAWYKASNALPAVSEALADPALTSDPNTKVFTEQLKQAKIAPPIKQWDAVAQEMTRAVEQITIGGADIDKTLASLDTKVSGLTSR
ncbi:sugar ABC transporter substrate-binding protein [Streptomyces himalayensis]|uniref:Sugar ABC transporter substrate-binding protein n=1 Tax=Streptomyces himalayensis subsp. himalayensis TaxID=2756131 RepID=A0A7W0DKZ2_9ACTN|nr:sugar ABC transporter substrate-binding protein [Streptomyces himalayensis]MBA2946991.1 sugar ABC transporter substrate-binding protein [Streptomyces himalayensis subsp. himalayensis]